MYSRDEAMDFSMSMRNSLKIMNEIGFADMNITPPDIDFYPDNTQYFDPQNYEIHIGVYGILDLFHPEDETEYLSALNYVRGHEEQHCRSTPSKPYALAISKGVETILEYIQEREEGFKRRFKNESDYELVANRILPQKGIYISWEMVKNIMAGIANSLEDGRIERIRANRFHGFEVLRRVFRGKFWEVDSSEFPPYEDMTAADKLRVITNQILCLSTCQLYEKGFVAAYSGTDLMDEIQQYHQHIGAAVMAGRCRGLLNPMKEIAKLLAPYIYEVCKYSATDIKMKEALETFIKSLIEKMLDENNSDTATELNEDTDEGSMNSTFPISDLVITLDDETFDKLAKNTNQSNTNGSGGIMIKREHPKEDEEQSKSSNGTSQKKTEGKSSQGEENKEKNGSEIKPNEANGKPSGKTDVNSQGLESSDENSSNQTRQETSAQQTGKAKEAKHVGREQMEAAKTEVEKAMAEAAKEARAEAETNIETINAHAAASRSRGYKETFDTVDPISPEDMKDICDFIELKRQYKLTDTLPAVLDARGKTLHRKNEQYFKSLSTPNVTFIDSGSIDPSRIYGLAMGDTDIFMKQGKAKKFDGCVYMLMDNSGSMAGKKREEACKAAAVIEEGFKGLIPVKIVAFDYHGAVIHEVIKEWDENLRKNCCWNFFKKGRDGYGNEDGYDIQVATRELLARPERKKMLLILSDGAPGDYNLCREAIRAARKVGIQVHGIYFEENGYDAETFEQMYEKDYIICQLNELDSHLQNIMKRFSRS